MTNIGSVIDCVTLRSMPINNNLLNYAADHYDQITAYQDEDDCDGDISQKTFVTYRNRNPAKLLCTFLKNL